MISFIVAVANNNIIGGNNNLLWHIPEDLKRFKEITSEHTIIMGRKTFESLPGVLPNRKHIVVTRDTNFQVVHNEVEIIHNINHIIHNFQDSPTEYFVIGGGEIYKQLIHNVDKIYLTKVHNNFEGDTTFPEIDYNQWNISYESDILISNKSGLKYQFINLEKKKG